MQCSFFLWIVKIAVFSHVQSHFLSIILISWKFWITFIFRQIYIYQRSRFSLQPCIHPLTKSCFKVINASDVKHVETSLIEIFMPFIVRFRIEVLVCEIFAHSFGHILTKHMRLFEAHGVDVISMDVNN